MFEDFSPTEMKDGYLLSKDEKKQLATFGYERKSGSFLIVKSNQLLILDDFFKYANHINRLLMDDYVLRAKEELKIIDERFKNLPSADSNTVRLYLSIDRYINLAEKGANVITFQRPSKPKKVSIHLFQQIILCVILGGTIGVVYVLISNSIRKRKKPF